MKNLEKSEQFQMFRLFNFILQPESNYQVKRKWFSPSPELKLGRKIRRG